MTEEQFEVLSELMNSDTSTKFNQAARAVLVNGMKQVEAVRLLGLHKTSVNKAVKMFRDAETKIRHAFCQQDPAV
jgi:hypothetical protein